MTALCKNGPERERDLGRFDADVAHINEVIDALPVTENNPTCSTASPKFHGTGATNA
jgi:hypothetical protein